MFLIKFLEEVFLFGRTGRRKFKGWVAARKCSPFRSYLWMSNLKLFSTGRKEPIHLKRFISQTINFFLKWPRLQIEIFLKDQNRRRKLPLSILIWSQERPKRQQLAKQKVNLRWNSSQEKFSGGEETWKGWSLIQLSKRIWGTRWGGKGSKR